MKPRLLLQPLESPASSSSNWEAPPLPTEAPPRPGPGAAAMIGSGSVVWRQGSSETSGVSVEVSDNLLGLKLFPGEKVMGQVRAMKRDPHHSPPISVTGILLCTNFRVAFIPAGHKEAQEPDPRAGPLGEDHVALTCIERLVSGSSARRSGLTDTPSPHSRPQEIILHCRDFRTLYFQLDPLPHSQKFTALIAQSCRPDSPQKLFVFDFAEALENSAPSPRDVEHDRDLAQTRMFETHVDWEREISRTGARRWRVSVVNERFEVSASLSKFLVVPQKILDLDIKNLSTLFTGGRFPRWHWHHAGSNLLRMGTFQSTSITHRDGLGKLEELLSGAHSHLVVVDLSEDLPTPADIHQAYSRLRSLCTPELAPTTKDGEEKWFSLLEATHWLEYVRLCLRKATQVSALLSNQRLTVTLQESDDRDLSCLVSSLVQLILDPESRTLAGFQSLVQKEWVTAGHRFTDRLQLLRHTQKDESPVFLLFLDCIWQLLDHYPFSFEFTDVYLLAVHSSTHTLLSGTFVFNCCREQVRTRQAPRGDLLSSTSPLSNGWALPQGEIAEDSRVVLKGGYFVEEGEAQHLPTAWDWSLLYSPEHQQRFRNVLYTQEHPEVQHNGGLLPHLTPQDPPSRCLSVHRLSRGDVLVPAATLPWRTPSMSKRLAKWSRSLENLLEPVPGLEVPRPSLSSSSLPFPFLPFPAPSLRLWRGCYLRWEAADQAWQGRAQLGALWDELRSLGLKLRPAAVATETPSLPKR